MTPERLPALARSRQFLILLLCAGLTAACGHSVTRDARGADRADAGGAPRSPGDEMIRVAIISDLNSAYGSITYGPEVQRAVALIRDEWRPDLVLASGDLIAGQRPTLTDDNVRAMWHAFDSAVAGPLRDAGIPFGFSVGNHDASAYPAHARDRQFAIQHWRMPQHMPRLAFTDSVNFPLAYSFRAGPLFVVAWDAASAMVPSDPEHLAWLESQLRSSAAQAATLRIVLGHLPLYAVAEGRDRPGEVLDQPDLLLAHFERLGVNIYISGHHHAYYPGRRGAVDLLHAGALGDSPRPLIGSTVPSPRTVTLLDVEIATGAFRYTTYIVEADGVAGTVRLEDLPLRIDGHNGFVLRR
jgi:hypothetical protein